MTRETCANRIKKALDIKNMKQNDLCERTGIPKSAISQYISGAFEPKQDRVYAIAKALDVSEAWLMGYDVPMERKHKNTSFDGENSLLPSYLSFAKDAQDNGILPQDIELALNMIKQLKGKKEDEK